jgi:hypothetical protein
VVERSLGWEVEWPHLFRTEATASSNADAPSQVCQWDIMPCEMKNSPVQRRSAAIRQKATVKASSEAGVSSDANANASAWCLRGD